jgi:uncharacterized protein (TIGR02453 family)
MISSASLKFLQALKSNNNKPWFDEHRHEYEILKKEMSALCQNAINEISKFDKSIISLEPKDCTFRINRDVRFSKDKSPYKTNVGAYMAKGGKKSQFSGYYIHIESGKSMLAGGLWMPEAPKLKTARQEIDYNFTDFKKIISNKNFEKYFGKVSGDKLVNAPKGYDDSNPALEYLKHKSWVVTHQFTDKEVLDKNFPKTIAQGAKLMFPFLQFFNQAFITE